MLTIVEENALMEYSYVTRVPNDKKNKCCAYAWVIAKRSGRKITRNPGLVSSGGLALRSNIRN